jgi:hypothetical protein
VDNDNDADILIAYDGHPSRVWLNDGKGNFADSGQRMGSGIGWGQAALGDLDNDGDLDAFLASSVGGTTWLNAGGMQGGALGTFAGGNQVLDDSPDVTLADADNEGDVDAFTCKAIWLNDGGGFFTIHEASFGPDGCTGVWLGDVDGDGDLDALDYLRCSSKSYLSPRRKQNHFADFGAAVHVILSSIPKISVFEATIPTADQYPP